MEHIIYDPTTEEYTRVPFTAEEEANAIAISRQDQLDYIKAMRDSLETAGFLYMGTVIDSDPRSVQRINTAVQAAQAAITLGVPFSVDWTAQDNSVVSMTAEDVIGMASALALYGNTLHVIARERKATILSATTVEEINAVKW